MSESFEDKLSRLNELRHQAHLGGGQTRIDKIHAKGRLCWTRAPSWKRVFS